MSFKINDAYIAKKVYSNTLEINDAITMPVGNNWTVVLISSKNSNDYQGVVFKDNVTGQYLLVNQGTELLSGGDLKADLLMGVGKLPDQINSAREFLLEAKTVISKDGGDPSTDLGLIGHSLGGSITQVLAAENPQLPASTFNAYGAGNLIPEGSYPNITNNVMAKDPVSVFPGSRESTGSGLAKSHLMP